MWIDLVNIAHAQEAATEAAKSPAAMFGLNWKLFLAQVINFSIVLLVLWKWVFGPLGKRLSDRQDRIEKALGDAKSIEAEKAELAQWKTAELTKTKQEASAIITQAKKEADDLKTSVLEQTKKEQAGLLEKAKKNLENETTAAVQKAKTDIADVVVEATSKILQEKLTTDKDKSLIERVLGTLKV